MEEILITIFTPTYNRCPLLARLYESLTFQTDKDFKWIVIDDGSTDNTRQYIHSLIDNERRFSIEYYYKENGGLYSGYNEAIRHINTKLCFCCDSDDWLPVDCINKIKRIWRKNGCNSVAGIIGLDFYKDDTVVGKKLPDVDKIDVNYNFIRNKIHGDKKYIVRTELYKKYYPIISPNGEKNFNPHYIHIQISEDYLWIASNENFCYVEYQNDGMSQNIYRNYIDSPNSFIKTRRQYIGLKDATIQFKCRHIIHYDAECILANKERDIFNKNSPSRLLSIILLPLGIVLYFYIKIQSTIFI